MHTDLTQVEDDKVTLTMTLGEFLTLRNSVKHALNTTASHNGRENVIPTIIRRTEMFQDFTFAIETSGGIKRLSEINKSLED